MWFPRPSCPEDVVLVTDRSALGRGELHAMMCHPEAREWRDKVGVSGPAEGSAKPSARLLSIDGWVLKTNLDLASDALDPLLERLRDHAARCRRLGLWHPDKVWAALRVDDRFYPLSACPELAVLRAMDDERRLDAWGRALALALDAASRHGVGLDVHPSNFGADAERLYYLDDELYEAITPREIGEAIASRVPEEEREEGDWRLVGRRLAGALAAQIERRAEWRQLDDGVSGYPLVARLEGARKALREGIREVAHPPRRARAAPRRTCVLADVHGNLPALEAVLDAARALGATDYLFLGDAVGYGPHPRECVERLRELGDLRGVRGNHDHGAQRGSDAEEGMNSTARAALAWTIDRLEADDRAWLAAMPRERGGAGWLAVHGAPRDPERFYAYVYELTFRENLEVLRERRLDVCFYGHTHVPFVHRRCGEGPPEKLGAVDVTVSEGGCRLLFNPGSVGQPRDGDPRAAFAIWDRAAGRLAFHRVRYPVEKTIRDIERAGLPRDLGNRLEMGR